MKRIETNRILVDMNRPIAPSSKLDIAENKKPLVAEGTVRAAARWLRKKKANNKKIKNENEN